MQSDLLRREYKGERDLLSEYLESEYEGERDFHETYRGKESVWEWETATETETETRERDVIVTDRPSLHHHGLAFSNKFDSGGDCFVCKQQITGPHYCCTSSSTSCPKFFIHNYPCFEIEDQIQHHPFHPQHTLSLYLINNVPTEDQVFLDPINDEPPNDCCHVCRSPFAKYADTAFVYRCDECTFCIDFKCASLSLTNSPTHDDDKQPISHPHPLILVHNKYKNFCYECNFCLLPIELEGSSFYVCLQCKALLHKSCAELPMNMEHPLHHEHDLILDGSYVSMFMCDVCQKPMRGVSYRCYVCDFDSDVRCAVLKYMKSNKAYKIYADYPQEIQHFLHPQHTLTWYSTELNNDISVPCQACLRYSKGFFFRCLSCKCYIHVRCALAKYTPMMSRTIHHHPLVFFNKSNTLFECNSCGQCCYTPFFRCFKCDFNLHVHCISILPHTIKYNHHIHPLTLTGAPIKDYTDEDDSAEFYCDACEELRALPDRSYYCKECSYVAHPHCMVSEILSILNEEWPELESDASRSKVKVTHVPDEECSKSHEVEEPPLPTLMEFLDAIDWFEGDWHPMSYYEGLYHRQSGFARLDFIMDKTVDPVAVIELPWRNWDPTSNVVTVGEYMILEDLVPILKALLARYGDFNCKCILAKNRKMLCVMVLCDVIRNMCNTKVEDITEHLLLTWFRSLVLCLEAKFRIDFAFRRLTRVAYARLGNTDIYHAKKEIAELKKKVERKEAGVKLAPDCRSHALNLKGQTAGEGLL